MNRFRMRLVLLGCLLVLTLGMVACESTGGSTVYVGVHGGYGYGPGWGWHGGYYPPYPVGPVW
jgi:hypothetical protein